MNDTYRDSAKRERVEMDTKGLQHRQDIRLKGKSRHGKNRINQFGEEFTIVDFRPNLMTTAHRGLNGPFMFLNCKKNLTEGSRWVSITDDPDFEVLLNG